MLDHDRPLAFFPRDIAFFNWNLGEDKVFGDTALATLFGLEPEALIGGLPILPVVQRIILDDRPRVAKAIHTAIISGGVYQEAYRVERANGKVQDVVAMGRCLRSADGVPSLYAGIVMDASRSDRPFESDPLKEHCRNALALANERGHDLVVRYLSSALRAVGDLPL